MTSYVLLLLLLTIPPGDKPMDGQGRPLMPGVVYPYTRDGVMAYQFRSLDDCREQMAAMAKEIHEESPAMKFALRCEPMPFYDGESA